MQQRESAAARAAQRFDELIGGPAFAQHTELLETGMREGNLRWRDELVCKVLRPKFVDGRIFDEAREGAIILSKALRTCAQASLQRAELWPWLGVTAPIAEFLEVTGCDVLPEVARADSFLQPDGRVRFIEFNSQSPGGFPFGLGTTDAISALFDSTPAMQSLGREFRFRRPENCPTLWSWLRRGWQEFSGKGDISMAAVLPEARPRDVTNVAASAPSRSDYEWYMTRDSHEQLQLAASLVSDGIPLTPCSISQLEYRGGTLYADGQPVNVVLTWDVPRFILDEGPSGPLASALRDRAVWMPSGLSGGLLARSKAYFAMLSDPRFEHLLPRDLTASARRWIPWTRVVEDIRTDFDGRQITLLEFVEANPERFVLKPATGFGGFGVSVGAACEPSVWRAALRQAAEGGWVVQERISVPHEDFPVNVGGRLEYRSLGWDLDPYVALGEAAGALVRVSGAPLLNLTSGDGSVAALFVCDGER